MGVPALFRWLSQKYPKVTSQVVEEEALEMPNGQVIPVDVTKPNPNGAEYDNLYLDMNGIIHPCTHPEDKPAPKTEEEMHIEIFKYIDRIVAMIRPRKVLYMAIDGVAPRAKMNQQRSRRFRAAQEAQQKQEEEDRLREEWQANHSALPEKEEAKNTFDSNCITPGTPFMSKLANALRYYVADRLNNNPGWKDLKVIFSDASVPGEGEHKIMDYIRRQRNMPNYDPSTYHVLYGLDADLIMLALATHEPNFNILREDVLFNQASNRGCFICGQAGHQASECTGTKKEKDENKPFVPKPYVFLHVNILREYLEMELKFSDAYNLSFKWDLDRAIDDWVFLCFFVGNDFLPHLPSLEIREGAIDKLVELWKKHVPTLGGYLTDSGDIDLTRVAVLMKELGDVEDEIFRNRRAGEERRRENRRRRKKEMEENERRRKERIEGRIPEIAAAVMSHVPSFPVKMTMEQRGETNLKAIQEKRQGVVYTAQGAVSVASVSTPSAVANKSAAEALRKMMKMKDGQVEEVIEEEQAVSVESRLKRKADELEPEASATVQESAPIEETLVNDTPVEEDDDSSIEEIVEEVVAIPVPPKKKAHVDKKQFDSEEEPEDTVRLWESGWKHRYYQDKFQVSADDTDFRRQIATKYVEGFCWVLKYYYQGVQSWTWYFPYHYSPFASDFDFIAELCIQFEMGEPFKPFEQLMGVLPAASRQHIPEAYQCLMTDPKSEIIDFYPENFPIDLNGKRHAWQGVALLPFIDEDRLKKAMKPYDERLSEEEIQRNRLGEEYLWFSGAHDLFDHACVLYTKAANTKLDMQPEWSQGLFGSILADPEACIPGSTFYSPLTEYGLEDISDCQCLSVIYKMPEYPPHYIFKAAMLSTAKLPSRLLDESDYWFVVSGGRGRGRGRGGNNQAAGRFIRHNINGHGRTQHDDTRHSGQRDALGRQSSYRERYNESSSYQNDRRPYSHQGSDSQSRQSGYNRHYKEERHDYRERRHDYREQSDYREQRHDYREQRSFNRDQRYDGKSQRVYQPPQHQQRFESRSTEYDPTNPGYGRGGGYRSGATSYSGGYVPGNQASYSAPTTQGYRNQGYESSSTPYSRYSNYQQQPHDAVQQGQPMYNPHAPTRPPMNLAWSRNTQRGNQQQQFKPY